MRLLECRCRLAAAGLAFLLAAGLPARAAYVITTTGQRIDGSDIRAKSDGEIVLTTPQGTRSFFKGQYVQAVADRPPEIDRVAQMVEAKQYDEAIKMLEDVALRYRYLEWDNQALTLLARVCAAKNDRNGAVAAYERLFAGSPKSREDADLQWAYREALLSAGQSDKLEPLLNKLIESGARGDAARAQIMRGDVRMAQNQVEAAALDYLRTVVLFESEQASQPEALLKTAQALEKLRDARAKEMYRTLAAKYPSSPQAAEARGKF